MRLKNRIASIKKWKEVRELFEVGRYRAAMELAESEERCGHCTEYRTHDVFNDCEKCPLYDEDRDLCHELVMDAITQLDTLASTQDCDDSEVREVGHLIEKVQKLVATK